MRAKYIQYIYMLAERPHYINEGFKENNINSSKELVLIFDSFRCDCVYTHSFHLCLLSIN